ncbi:hypothetical protein KAM461_15200 [Aeromonas hydrophila]|nr:hypothetical protein KAM461_15200 [Aeromonas hydrophila]
MKENPLVTPAPQCCFADSQLQSELRRTDNNIFIHCNSLEFNVFATIITKKNKAISCQSEDNSVDTFEQTAIVGTPFKRGET